MTRDEAIAYCWAEYDGEIIRDVTPAKSGWWITWVSEDKLTLVVE